MDCCSGLFACDCINKGCSGEHSKDDPNCKIPEKDRCHVKCDQGKQLQFSVSFSQRAISLFRLHPGQLQCHHPQVLARAKSLDLGHRRPGYDSLCSSHRLLSLLHAQGHAEDQGKEGRWPFRWRWWWWQCQSFGRRQSKSKDEQPRRQTGPRHELGKAKLQLSTHLDELPKGGRRWPLGASIGEGVQSTGGATSSAATAPSSGAEQKGRRQFQSEEPRSVLHSQGLRLGLPITTTNLGRRRTFRLHTVCLAFDCCLAQLEIRNCVCLNRTYELHFRHCFVALSLKQ